jgi:hypothetical protein
MPKKKREMIPPMQGRGKTMPPWLGKETPVEEGTEPPMKRKKKGMPVGMGADKKKKKKKTGGY